MKRHILHIGISATALVLALGHVIFPNVKVDAVTAILLLIALLPWLGSIFKSVELPGGLKVEYRELEKVGQAAAGVGLLVAPHHGSLRPSFVATIEEDPNLALAGLRIEIERRLRTIANGRGLNAEQVGIGQLLRLLRTNGIISENEYSVLNSLLKLLNRAVHGAEVDSRAARWAIEVGPQLLAGLDEHITETENR
jgi:hypothetical protein